MASKTIIHCAAALLTAAISLPALAQSVGLKGGSGAGVNATTTKGGSTLTTAQMQQRQLQAIRQVLGSSDDEFAVLSPKIEKLLTLRHDANLPGSGSGRIVGGSGVMPTQQPDGSPLPPVLFARAELQNAVQDPSAAPELIVQKLAALRAAQLKAQEEITTAEKDLISVLTPRQESLLVLNEILH
jgi:hypothetical protein